MKTASQRFSEAVAAFETLFPEGHISEIEVTAEDLHVLMEEARVDEASFPPSFRGALMQAQERRIKLKVEHTARGPNARERRADAPQA